MPGSEGAPCSRWGKEQCRESNAACERGRARTASSQVVTEEKLTKSTSSFVPAGHKGAAMRTKEMADAEVPMQAKL